MYFHVICIVVVSDKNTFIVENHYYLKEKYEKKPRDKKTSFGSCIFLNRIIGAPNRSQRRQKDIAWMVVVVFCLAEKQRDTELTLAGKRNER